MFNQSHQGFPARFVAQLAVAATLLTSNSAHSRSAVDLDSACGDLSLWRGSSSPAGIIKWKSSNQNDSTSTHVEDLGSSKFDTTLTSPAFIVPDVGLELQVAQQMQLSWANSAGVLEISIANSEWMDIAEAGGHFEEGGYNLRAYTGNPIGMRPAWAGSRPTFRTTAVLPEDAKRQSVRLRFRLGSGGTGDVYSGWRLHGLRCK